LKQRKLVQWALSYLAIVMLGERELAFDSLERIVAEGGGYADWAIMLPAMDPIRCEPRFVAVVKKMRTTDS
jgi:hypothetical protein